MSYLWMSTDSSSQLSSSERKIDWFLSNIRNHQWIVSSMAWLSSSCAARDLEWKMTGCKNVE